MKTDADNNKHLGIAYKFNYGEYLVAGVPLEKYNEWDLSPHKGDGFLQTDCGWWDSGNRGVFLQQKMKSENT